MLDSIGILNSDPGVAVNLPHDGMIGTKPTPDAPAKSDMGYFTGALTNYTKFVMIPNGNAGCPLTLKGGKWGMKTSGISPRDKVLRAIIDFEDAEGYPPSVRELCTLTGIRSTSTIHSHIAKLQEKGYISKISAQSRSIRVLKTA